MTQSSKEIFNELYHGTKAEREANYLGVVSVYHRHLEVKHVLAKGETPESAIARIGEVYENNNLTLKEFIVASLYSNRLYGSEITYQGKPFDVPSYTIPDEINVVMSNARANAFPLSSNVDVTLGEDTFMLSEFIKILELQLASSYNSPR